MAAPTRSQLEAYARQAAIKNGVDPNIFVAQINQESGFNPAAHNPSGASGIAQLMPQYYPNVDTSDPYASLDAAAQTMGQNVKRNGGDYAKALAAYDAGQGAVDKYGGVPPFAETQQYVKVILGSAGGKTMGQMQGGNPPPADNRPPLPGQMTPGLVAAVDPEIAAIIAMAADGDPATPTPPQGAPASDPALADPNGVASGMDGTTILRILEAKYNLPHTQARIATKSTTDPNTFQKTDTSYTTRYTWSNGKTLDIETPSQQGLPNYVLRGSALADLGNTAHSNGSHSSADNSSPWIVYFDENGKVVGKDPNPNYQPGTGPKSTVSSADNSNPFLVHFDANGNITGTERNPNYIPPAGQDPNEVAYKKALTAQAEASTAKINQSLRPVAQAAIEDAYQIIDAIKADVAAGRKTPAEASELMAQVHQGLAQTLTGTTVFEVQKQAQDTQTQRASQAASLLNQRVQSAASLGSSLFGAATANGGILAPKGGGSWGIDPMQIANGEVNQMGGGQGTGDAAAAFLKAALSGGGAPPGPGQPGPSPFPTTREAVLAQYPHLASQGQAATFIPPNNEQNAGGPGITVAPPTPIDGNIPTLLASIGQGGR